MLLHAPGCERAESFVPTLSRIAEKVPGLAYGRIDVAQGGSVPSRLRGLSARGGWRAVLDQSSCPGQRRDLCAPNLLHLPANVIIELLDAIIAV